MLMTACDISAITKPWPVQKRVKTIWLYILCDCLWVCASFSFFQLSLCFLLVTVASFWQLLFVSAIQAIQFSWKQIDNQWHWKACYEVFIWFSQTALSFWLHCLFLHRATVHSVYCQSLACKITSKITMHYTNSLDSEIILKKYTVSKLHTHSVVSSFSWPIMELFPCCFISQMTLLVCTLLGATSPSVQRSALFSYIQFVNSAFCLTQKCVSTLWEKDWYIW